MKDRVAGVLSINLWAAASVALLLLLLTLTLTVAGSSAIANAQPAPRPPATRSTPEASREASPESSPTNHGNASDNSTNWTIASSRDIKVKGQPVTISPDGKWIAGPGADKDFCVWDVATLEATCGGKDLAIQSETIRWAPDSSAVAFSLEAAKYFIDSDIYVFDVKRGKLEDLTEDGLEGPVKLGRTPGTGPVNLDIFPAWSPDSTKLLFARSDWNSETRGTTLMTIAREGGDAQPLFVLAPPEPLIIYSPMFWLADDSILFSVWRPDSNDGQNGVWLREASGKLTHILKGDATSKVPMPAITSVSPDGNLATVTSALKQSQFGSNARSGIYFALDIQSRQLVDVPKPADSPSAFVSLPARISDDGNTTAYVVRDGDSQRIAIESIQGDAPTYLPFDQVIGPSGYTSGLELVAGNTLFIPTNGSVSGTAVILTLTPPVVDQATPVPACGCIDPDEG